MAGNEARLGSYVQLAKHAGVHSLGIATQIPTK